MPNTKSAVKAARTSERKRKINQRTKDKMKEAVKKVRKLNEQGQKEQAAKQLQEAMSAIDKAAKKNVIKKNKASRLKSRLSKAVSRETKRS